MTDIIRVLAQGKPTAGALTDLYTVPAGTTAVISSVIVCNQANSTSYWGLSVAIGGAADSPKQYLYYDLIHPGLDTFIATVGITLSAGDVVRVYSVDGNLSFNLSGVEES